MDSTYPAIADCAVTAAAMRAAASIIEESALAGLSVTCEPGQITVQVCECSGDPAERAAQVGLLAGIAGTQAYRHDSPVTAYCQVKAYGHVRGIPVSIFTPIRVRTRPADTGPVPLATDPGGQVTAVPGGQLPCGSRWCTELDPEPAGTAAGQEAA
jgi:hypothetical protein